MSKVIHTLPGPAPAQVATSFSGLFKEKREEAEPHPDASKVCAHVGREVFDRLDQSRPIAPSGEHISCCQLGCTRGTSEDTPAARGESSRAGCVPACECCPS
jgi:hypothetical protein